MSANPSSEGISRRLDRLARRYARKPAVGELSLAVAHPPTGFAWTWGADRPYFIASITKLFTAASIMQLRAEGRLELDTRAVDILGSATMRGLAVVEGIDRSAEVTVGQLLRHTSGIPDYFELRGADGTSLAERMLTRDESWDFDRLVQRARELPSPFAPGSPGRAHYSDTNYQLLGRLIELCTGRPFEQVVRSRIIEPLGLSATWLFTRDTLGRYDSVASIRHGRRDLRIPLTMASFAPDGAVVATAEDQLAFLRAFLSGELFPAEYLAEMTAEWNSPLGGWVPLQYGVGIMRFALPRWQTFPIRVPPMIGHAGATGSVLFADPVHGLLVAGTVNQMQPRRLPYPLLARITAAVGPLVSADRAASVTAT
ncbi:serine hydrolase domain-containing protein [Microbacterium lushaniae]|uniref:Beta-lactamase family protein n=1 Tax=Microbacterium lushaniae TaxID=2614639 RepID=A0A5J6L0M7_9MICO|nr:serine hydrolase domain-containing protein [Microbacterium lushaniae]QEW01936.1 beta-lactamase family protein [Microbacterium lushaniae]